MLECFSREDSLCVVVDEHLREEVEGVLAAEGLVLGLDELVPGLHGHSQVILKVLAKHLDELLIELEVILLHIFVKVVGSENLGDLHELVSVAVPHEEGLLLEDLHEGGLTIEANIAPVDQMSRE